MTELKVHLSPIFHIMLEHGSFYINLEKTKFKLTRARKPTICSTCREYSIQEGDEYLSITTNASKKLCETCAKTLASELYKKSNDMLITRTIQLYNLVSSSVPPEWRPSMILPEDAMGF